MSDVYSATSNHLVCDYGHRVHITHGCNLFAATKLLRRHVKEGTHRCVINGAWSNDRILYLSDAKIHDFHQLRVSSKNLKQNVFRLEVPMKNSLFVNIVECGAKLFQNQCSTFQIHALRRNLRTQSGTVYVL